MIRAGNYRQGKARNNGKNQSTHNRRSLSPWWSCPCSQHASDLSVHPSALTTSHPSQSPVVISLGITFFFDLHVWERTCETCLSVLCYFTLHDEPNLSQFCHKRDSTLPHGGILLHCVHVCFLRPPVGGHLDGFASSALVNSASISFVCWLHFFWIYNQECFQLFAFPCFMNRNVEFCLWFYC